MKRHPSLHPLSQHHHFALIQALAMKRTAETASEQRGAGPDRQAIDRQAVDRKALDRQAAKFVSFWHKTGLAHFKQEEEVLLPALARVATLDQEAGAERIVADHAEIRTMVQDFERCLASNRAIEPAAMSRLAKLLHDHVRFEENEFFPRVERMLGEKDLDALGTQLTRLHAKHDVCDV